MSIFIAVVLGLLGISFLIFAHELGHFLAARAVGMTVTSFSIGFGPTLLYFDRKGVRYQLCLFPLGGYIELLGQGYDDQEINESIVKLLEEPGRERSKRRYERKEGWFKYKNGWSQLLVVLAGPFFSALLGLILFIGFYHHTGEYAFMNPPTLSAPIPVTEESTVMPQTDDIIVSFNNRNVSTVEEFTHAFPQEEGLVAIEVLRGEDRLQGEIEITGTISLYSVKQPLSEQEILRRAWLASSYSFSTNMEGFRNLLFGKADLEQVSGPVGIIHIGSQMITQGKEQALLFLAQISIALSALNLLPLPALDGGHALFAIWRIVTGKPVSKRLYDIGMRISVYLLLGLAGFITVREVLSLMLSAL